MDAMELPSNRNCSIARSLSVLGQKWNLLIMREAHRGHTRYADFRRIGIPSDILATRLDALVEDGLLERQPYHEPGQRVRDEYVLTEAGRDLLPVLAALTEWGDKHRPTGRGPTAIYVDETSGAEVRLDFVPAGMPPVADAVRMAWGPGYDGSEPTS